MKDENAITLRFVLPGADRMRRLICHACRHEAAATNHPRRRQILLAGAAGEVGADAALLVARSSGNLLAFKKSWEMPRPPAGCFDEVEFFGPPIARDIAATIAARQATTAAAFSIGHAAALPLENASSRTADPRAAAWIAIGNGLACVLLRNASRLFTGEEATGVALALSVLLPPTSRRQDLRRSPSTKVADTFTPREQAVLTELLGGGSEKQVARKLQRSTHTIHSYVKRLYKRFKVTSRAELLARFVDREAAGVQDRG